MLYKTTRLDVSYQASFRSLAFDLVAPGKAATILKEVFDRINPRYAIRTSDMKVFFGVSMAEFRVNIVLFNGLGELDLNPERLLISFTNVKGQEDIKIIKDVVTLAMEAFKVVLPNVPMREDLVRFSAFIELSKGKALNFLQDLMRGSAVLEHLKSNKFEGSSISFGLKSEVEDREKRWSSVIDMGKTTWPEVLLLTGTSIYQDGGPIKSAQEKIEHSEKIANTFLESIGLKSEK
ncbi:MAG TPA: hypothetical protein VK138_10355 [Acidiferrobacterales bacterium]|nr:hypothetical protein [Acidiferrobacterales bacterium]